MPATPTYEVLALRYGIFDGRLQFQNYIIPDDHAAPDPLDFYVFAIKGNGRTIENEIYFNTAQKPLIEHPKGIFTMDEDGIAKNVEALNLIGIKATKDMFDTSLLAEI